MTDNYIDEMVSDIFEQDQLIGCGLIE